MDYLSFDSELLFDVLIIQVTALRCERIVISRSRRVAASIFSTRRGSATETTKLQFGAAFEPSEPIYDSLKDRFPFIRIIPRFG
jgi:hypothetical protein